MTVVFFAVVVSLISAAESTGLDLNNLERVIVPIAFRGELSGAMGSRWVSQLAVTNTSDHHLRIFGYHYAPSGCIIQCGEPGLTPPGITFYPTIVIERGRTAPAALFLVDRSNSHQVHFQSRIRDLSRQHQSWGTQVPVVRERDTSRRALSLIDVPLESGFRQMLRLYYIYGRSDVEVRVRVFATDPDVASPIDPYLVPRPSADVLLDERLVRLKVQPGIHFSDVQFDFSYEELDLQQLLPTRAGRLRIEIEGVNVQNGLWGFVSVTHNATQHVTVISPQ